jgi:hypothetical protein
MMRLLLASLVLLVAVATHADTTSPDAEAETALQKVGEAKLKVLFFDVYRSTLFTPTGDYQPELRPLRLEITYLRDIAASDLVKQTGKEWRAQEMTHPRQQDWLDQLASLWPDVSDGDVIALQLGEDNIARFDFNDEYLGTIDDPDFGEQFAGIWLSPNTTRPALRKQLIGAAD